MSSTKKLLNQNLTEDDKNAALESLRKLVTGIPIRDSENEIIGYIEKPDMRAIAYVLGKFDNDIKEDDTGGGWGNM
jgi:hypothetical protein